MNAPVTTAQVWACLEKESFAVVGFVTARGEARTAGVVFTARERRLYFGTERTAWKARHISARPSVSMTVTVPKSIPFIPWLRIPPATITFAGTARVLALSDAPAGVPEQLLDKLEPKDTLLAGMAIVEVEPKGDFLTYGVGVSLKTMLRPKDASGRAPVT